MFEVRLISLDHITYTGCIKWLIDQHWQNHIALADYLLCTLANIWYLGTTHIGVMQGFIYTVLLYTDSIWTLYNVAELFYTCIVINY